MKFLSPERMSRYDAYAINTWGIPSAVLMENAGRSTYRLMKEEYLKDRQIVLILCGRGNNGGDGFVIARYALRDGYETKVFLLGKISDLRGDAALNMKLYAAIGGETIEIEGDVSPIREACSEAAIIVDAIFGTGLSKNLEGRESRAIEAINESARPIIAVDIPSGIDGGTGSSLGGAVKATHTYTYGYPKPGQLLFPGAYHTGRLTVVDISIPVVAEASLGIDGYIADGAMIREFYRERQPWDHKGTYGHVAVVAGSPGKTGAAYMAATAALKIGAGLVTLLVPQAINSILETKTTEAMTLPVEDGGTGYFRLSAYDKIMEFIADKDLVIVGPGLGQEPDTMELVRRVYEAADKPFVVDADGINAFQAHPEAIGAHRGGAVFTPHPGELARITGKTPSQINADRIEAGRNFVKEKKVNLLLKGAGSIYFSTEGDTCIIPVGNPALAKGGSGDILTGFIGGLAGQGYSLHEAAIFGAYLHGYIADTWQQEETDMDLLAGDLLHGLGRAIKEIRDGTDRVYIEKRL